MIKIKGNYFILGVAISYIIVAIIQITIPGSLNAAIYFTVAFVSLELSTLELIKTIIGIINKIKTEQNQLINNACIQLQNTIAVIKKYELLHDETTECEKELKKLTEMAKETNKNNLPNRLNKVYSVISAIQIIVCVVQIIITPLKVIPYDLNTNQVINVCGLISFATLFFSCFITNLGAEIVDSMCLKQETTCHTASYYLKLMEQMSAERGENHEPTL